MICGSGTLIVVGGRTRDSCEVHLRLMLVIYQRHAQVGELLPIRIRAQGARTRGRYLLLCANVQPQLHALSLLVLEGCQREVQCFQMAARGKVSQITSAIDRSRRGHRIRYRNCALRHNLGSGLAG